MSAAPGSGRENESYVVGVDFGTLSGRAVVVRVQDGAELGAAEHVYPHGVIDEALPAGGPRLPPEWALQMPSDYIEVLRRAVPEALATSGVPAERVIGVGTDFTSCTMIPVTADGTPLCELPQYASRPHAYVKLWKHHSAQPQADRINALAAELGEPWLDRYGGRISSEGQFAKGLQLLEEDPELYDLTDHWVEATDWIVWQLCGSYVRSACAAGYKGLLQDGAHPSEAFLAALAPGFRGFVRDKVEHPTGALGTRAGGLSARAAAWTGLPEGIAVCVGNIDAHVTVPATGSAGAGRMVLIMGTSSCHMVSSAEPSPVPGMSGVVDGGIVPGLWGYEAGQSGVGDIFGWFVRTAVPESCAREARRLGLTLHDHLTRLSAGQAVGEHGLVALDWLSGNRSVLVDHELSGTVVGLTLATRPEDVYRALLESTAFGTRRIIEAFEEAGVPVSGVTLAGGLLENTFLTQLYADVIRRPLSLIRSSRGPALGSAMHAAVAAGAYRDIHAAAAAMGGVRHDVHEPDPDRAAAYDLLYAEYCLLHDYFGRGANDVMHRLRQLRRTAVSTSAQTVTGGTPPASPPL
ncbi:ribulokinase [Streptomyces sp. NBC_00859]|uniref:ribulokinase n=1 Tax=Streptomyces sp. NBC_00859 TaxID=2903682 RepID=UPI0038677E8D|nr:ribulokinase [Streptomyces sp. NBC_00859]